MDKLDKIIMDYVDQQEGLTEEEILMKASLELILPIQIINKFEYWKNRRRFINNGDKNHNNYEYVANEIRKDILSIVDDENYVVNLLVEHYYNSDKPNIGGKRLLWDVFGDVMLANLEENIEGTTQCDRCKERFVATKQRQTNCLDCQKIIKNEKANLRKIKFRNKDTNKQ